MKFSSFKALFCFLNFIYLSLVACNFKSEKSSYPILPSATLRYIASESGLDKAKRFVKNHQFENVGMIVKDGKPYCSGTIIKHGVFLTAKHCFSGRQFGGEGLRHFSLAFLTQSDSPEHPFVVKDNDLIRIFPDEGYNDLAYILYQPEATSGKINLVAKIANSSNWEEDWNNLILVGFPKITSIVPQKIFSENCSLGEISGRYRKYPKSLFYRGELFSTTCPAYFGNSGGPALSVKIVNSEAGISARLQLIGVVAHTFNDENALKKDEFGVFVDNANISPLNHAKSLSYVLGLDLLSLNDSIFLGNKKISLKTPALRIRDWLDDKKQFTSIFYPSKDFWKTSRDHGQIAKKRQDYETKYGNSQDKCPIEFNRVQNIFNNLIDKNKLKVYLAGVDTLKIFIDCENGGLDAGNWSGSLIITKGMVNALKTDGALACLVSHEMSHHLLGHDKIKRNEVLISRKELDADSLGAAIAIQSGYTNDDCRSFLKLTSMLDATIAGSYDPYPSSYERLQNLKDLIITRW